MEEVSALARYRAYLEAVDVEAQRTRSETEYLDLLAPSEVIDLLCARDEITELHLNDGEQVELARLDDLLLKHYQLVAKNVPPHPEEPRAHWSWRLHEGPRVREEVPAAAEASYIESNKDCRMSAGAPRDRMGQGFLESM